MKNQRPAALVDRPALARHRARARLDQAGFLHDEARFELQERLIDVNRSFTRPAIVTPFPAEWDGFLLGAVVVPDAEVIDLAPGAHDLVIHAMGLHWADDPVGQIVQCRRALAPDGLFLAVCFAGETLGELRAALGQAEIETLGGLSPRIAPMGELRDLGGLLQRAGFALPVADSTRREVHYATLPDLMADLRAMGETNALASRHRAPTPRRLFRRAAEIYAAGFPTEGGRIRATFELAFLTGWTPHESQQKPLRPGSANTRLADALHTTEFDDTATPVLDREPD
ncbi:MAG: SAM-dependent methyltransferase [Roseicyclus sp.]|nr:SAM-dependent methyltransferase [Roseicyclus sp.]MBO6625467.1 SAM-dependent methyltransferase [Roseicyclus sp.]MBO6923459.1 SAM-dependent methyltransferase [Roseicyclus sp.]